MFYFHGVKLSDNRLSGYIDSEDLNKHFGKAWMDWYQRERITKKKKVDALVSIFRNNQPIDEIKLSLKGKATFCNKTEALLEGDIHVLDGQQRLYALKESGVQNYRMPVQVYLNLTPEEETALFHQFNSSGTDLTFGELAKSYTGPGSDLLRNILKRRNYPMKVVVNGSKNGLTTASFCPLLILVHRRLILDTILYSVPKNVSASYFLTDPSITTGDLELVDFGVQNLLRDYIALFGEYHHQATAYRRTFFMAWNHICINSFMNRSTGKLAYGKFESKITKLPDLLRNSRTLELIGSSGSTCGGHTTIYNLIIEHLNHKLRDGHLPRLEELETRKLERSRKILGSEKEEHFGTAFPDKNYRSSAISN